LDHSNLLVFLVIGGGDGNAGAFGLIAELCILAGDGRTDTSFLFFSFLSYVIIHEALTEGALKATT